MKRALKTGALILAGATVAGIVWQLTRPRRPRALEPRPLLDLPLATMSTRRPTDDEIQLVMALAGTAGWPRTQMQYGTRDGQPYVVFHHDAHVRLTMVGVDNGRTFIITHINEDTPPDAWKEPGLPYKAFLALHGGGER